MDSRITWLGPAVIAGGLGAAIFCGAGQASADTGANAGSAGQVNTSASGGDHTARVARSAPVRAAAARAGAPKAAAAVPPSKNTSPAAALAAKTAAAGSKAASAPVVPSSVPIDPAQYAGTYYEQGSVKQFFSIGLVNTKAVYTVKQDGSLGVQNSGNYFFRRGPKSSIVGSAVPVNDINTALNVGFFGRTPSATPPGNYLIVDRAPDYSWAIVSDSSGRSGFILTRSQTIDPQTYQELVARARELGVTGRITPTRQFPS